MADRRRKVESESIGSPSKGRSLGALKVQKLLRQLEALERREQQKKLKKRVTF